MVPETGGAENRLGCPDERLPPAEGMGEGSTVSAAQRYKRQATVYREKSIDDWKTAVAAATDPDDPRRGLLYTFYQALYRDEHLQTTIDNRVLPIQQSEVQTGGQKRK